MLLAELNIRHTRRHMPTRRVAVDSSSLPTGRRAYGAVLLGAVVAEFAVGLDEEQHEMLPRVLKDARDGRLAIPSIALRYRLQIDMHGLDRSRHRIVTDAEAAMTAPVLELDVHGAPVPQVLGAVMAAAALPSSARAVAFRAIDAAVKRPGELPEGFVVERRLHGLPGAAPPPPGTRWTRSGGAAAHHDDPWRGVPSDQRWAMEVLGLGAQRGTTLERADVQARFRRLVRQAHPDHGATSAGAAERIAELTEARQLLLVVLDEPAL